MAYEAKTPERRAFVIPFDESGSKRDAASPAAIQSRPAADTQVRRRAVRGLVQLLSLARGRHITPSRVPPFRVYSRRSKNKRSD